MNYSLDHRDEKELSQVKEGRVGWPGNCLTKHNEGPFPGLGLSGAARGWRTEYNVLLVLRPPFCFSSTLAPTHAKV